MFELGKAPISVGIWTSVPMVLSLIAFAVGFSFFAEVRTVYWTMLWVLLACTAVLYFSERPYGSFAHAAAAILVFLRFVETLDPAFLGTWFVVSFALAFVTSRAAVSKDTTANLYARIFFEFLGYQGFFWSLYAVLLVYTPGSYALSFGPSAFGVCVTVGVLLWWAFKANHLRRRVQKNAGS